MLCKHGHVIRIVRYTTVYNHHFSSFSFGCVFLYKNIVLTEKKAFAATAAYDCVLLFGRLGAAPALALEPGLGGITNIASKYVSAVICHIHSVSHIFLTCHDLSHSFCKPYIFFI
jgi:hypothetical protein